MDGLKILVSTLLIVGIRSQFITDSSNAPISEQRLVEIIEKTLLASAKADALTEMTQREMISTAGVLCNSLLATTSPMEPSERGLALLTSAIVKRLSKVSSDPTTVVNALRLVNTSTVLPECQKKNSQKACLALPVRFLSGLCNNVENAFWGSIGEPLASLLDNNFQDGLEKIRQTGSTGEPLPTPKRISEALLVPAVDQQRLVSAEVSFLVPAFWYLVQQDLFQLIPSERADGSCPDCCASGQRDNACVDMSNGTGTCLPYVRFEPALRTECILGPRIPVNLATSYLDASHVYGTTEAKLSTLRTFESGMLKLSDGLPPTIDSPNCRGEQSCFDFASFQSNFHPLTAGLHVLLLRHHNRLAQDLQRLNPHWNEQRLFSESRRILIAQWQTIVYRELLPILIGPENLRKFDLELSERPKTDFGYRLNISSQISQSFVVASQAVHSMWPDFLMPPTNMSNVFRLQESIFRSGDFIEQPEFLGSLMNSALRSHPMRADRMFGIDLATLPLFRETSSTSTVFDLPAFIVQMNRDMGLQPYTKWRQFCGLAAITSFEDLSAVFDADSVQMLKSIYRSTNDIDLLIGALSEMPVPGGLLGPTFSCILGEQFRRLKFGDRFWFQNRMPWNRFSEDQLNEIKSTTLARLLCNYGGISRSQPWALLTQDFFENLPLPCSSQKIGSFNITKWRDAERKPIATLNTAVLKKAIELGQRLADEKRKVKLNQTFSADDMIKDNTSIRSRAAYLHYMMLMPDDLSKSIKRTSEVLLETTRLLLEKGSLFGDEIPTLLNEDSWQAVLPSIDISSFVHELPESRCLPRTIPCDETRRFRSSSGWCNNLYYPTFGVSHTVARRLLLPAYDDGFNEPRNTAVSGNPLPGARTVSTKVHSTISRNHPRYTMLLPQFGQYLDHDLTLAPLSSDANGAALSCSKCDSRLKNEDCFPIPVAKDDPAFSTFRQPFCIPFTRSQLGQLNLGYRNQLNQVTSFVDASQIYGSDDCRSSRLRSHVAGRMTIQNTTAGEALPMANLNESDCRSGHATPCFSSGESRPNEQIGISSMHVIFVREHNAIADQLAKLNPSWSDEKIFQESRRLVIALHQHVSYNEWLPKVLGLPTMDEFGLSLLRTGYFNGYDPDCDASISSEFSSAAFRFGHSLVSSLIPISDSNYQPQPSMELLEGFNNPSRLYQTHFADRMIMGMSSQRMQASDRFVSPTIRDNLFGLPGRSFSGLDLISFNINRGRDHGTPPYVQLRRLFRLPEPQTFEDLLAWMQNDTVVALANVYESVKDIDLFTGMMCERPLIGSLVGPTAGKIIAEQFSRLRKCDRFWYENANLPGTFTQEQLAEIRGQSFANILCRQLPSIQTIQPQVFSVPDNLINARKPCRDYAGIDFTHWIEREKCQVGSLTLEIGMSGMVSPCTSCVCTTIGVRCSTVRVKNCLKLLRSKQRAAVLADTSCFVQCFTFLKLL